MRSLKCMNCNGELSLFAVSTGNIVHCEYCNTPHYLENNLNFEDLPTRLWLMDLVYECFSMEELRTVCNKMYAKYRVMDFEDILGTMRKLKAQEAVMYAKRRGMLTEFITMCASESKPFALAIDSKR